MNQAHYPGDCTNYDPSKVYGPDRFGACYAPTGASYDAELNRTTITFQPIPPSELQERLAQDMARTILQRARLAEVVGA